jgi:dihydroorotate dehydrogenase electron transfer subunit
MNSQGIGINYADQALHTSAAVIENFRLARDTFRIRLECPAIARRIVPGQFVMLRLDGCNDPLLGRPLALYDIVLDKDGSVSGIDVVYLVTGKMTARLAELRARDQLQIWGPLGNGFSAEGGEHVIMVAGGIGQTPFLALARECRGLRRYGESQRTVATAKAVTLCYGARSAEYLAGVEDFRDLGIDVRLSTDDGSAGDRGFVTELLRQLLTELDIEASLDRCRIVCCGPEKMMEAVARIASEAKVPCQVSLETPMACGIGICFSCVAKVRQKDGSWDYRRTCVEGPVFAADQIVW